MIFTRIQSIVIDNDEWEALEEYLGKPRKEMTTEEISKYLDRLYGDELWWSATELYLYDNINERR